MSASAGDVHVLLVADGGGGLKATVLSAEGVESLMEADTFDRNRGAREPYYFSGFPCGDEQRGPILFVDGQARIGPQHLERARLLLHVNRIVVPRYVPGHYEI